MQPKDRQIGKNVAAYRGTRSQADIAKDMRARGWKWSQATVSGVETGERPLRLAEASDLGKVLRQDVSALLGSDPLSELVIKTQETIKASGLVERAVLDFLRSKARLVISAEAAEKEVGELPDSVSETVERVVRATAESIVDMYRDRVFDEFELTPDSGKQSRWEQMFREAEGIGEHPEEA